MFKIKYLLAFVLVALMASSCVTDDSTTASGNSSRISLETALAKTYTLNRWDTLKIAPQVQQTNTAKDLSYEWEVNHKVVATTKDLNYVCSEFGKYPCRLKVSNGDDIQYYEFSLDVLYSYVEGLYILAQHQGKTIVSYLPDSVQGKSFSLDVLEKNNPGVDFSGEPKAIDNTIARDNVTPLIYVAAGSPSSLYEINANLMTISRTNKAQGDISYVAKSKLSYPKSELLVVDKKLYRLTLSDTTFVNLTTKIESSLGHRVEFADRTVTWKQEDLSYIHGYVAFDNANGSLIGQNVQSTKVPTELLAGTFTGEKLVGMGSVDKERTIAIVTYNPTSSKFTFYHIHPGFYTTNKRLVSIPASVKYKGEMSSATGIQTGSIVRTASTKNLMYYTNGNKLYAYNVLSDGNFPTSALTTFGGSSETIVDLYINSSESKLYVATNDAGATLQGSIYCYDLNNRKLLWEKKNITGKIKGITYRE